MLGVLLSPLPANDGVSSQLDSPWCAWLSPRNFLSLAISDPRFYSMTRVFLGAFDSVWLRVWTLFDVSPGQALSVTYQIAYWISLLVVHGLFMARLSAKHNSSHPHTCCSSLTWFYPCFEPLVRSIGALYPFFVSPCPFKNFWLLHLKYTWRVSRTTIHCNVMWLFWHAFLVDLLSACQRCHVVSYPHTCNMSMFSLLFVCVNEYALSLFMVWISNIFLLLQEFVTCLFLFHFLSNLSCPCLRCWHWCPAVAALPVSFASFFASSISLYFRRIKYISWSVV